MKYILDTGMGTELQERGVNVPDWKKSIWSADALIHNPESVKDIHKANIEAGSNVIITNNYYVTPNILRREALEADFKTLIQKSIDLAKDARSNRDDVIIAGSFPPIETSFRPDLTPESYEIIDLDGQVDIIICETMSSIREGKIACEIALKAFDEVWLSWTTRGVDGSKLISGESLEDAIIVGNKIGASCQLLNCTATNLVTDHLETMKKANEFGAYANSHALKESHLIEDLGEDVDPDINHYHNSVSLSPHEYAKQAKIWFDEGAYVIGGCCMTGPDHIKALVKIIN